MKYIVILLILFGSFQYIYKPLSLKQASSSVLSQAGQAITVYGRDSCSITQQTLSYMRDNNIEHQYANIDNEAIASSLHQQMRQQGISTRRYNLPVVDFSGELSVRPSAAAILEKARY